MLCIPDTWRLPAEQLEELIADLVRERLMRNDIAARLVCGLPGSETMATSARLKTAKQTKQCLALMCRADVCSGKLTVHLSMDEVAGSLGFTQGQIDPIALLLEARIRMRWRSVKLKLHLGDAPLEIDRTLIQNIVKAQHWITMTFEGMTFAEIAKAEGTSKHRVQDVIDLAMLAPDIARCDRSGRAA